MASKKYMLLTALMLVSASGVWAQLGGVHNYMDSNYIPASRMAQQNEWKNNSPSQNFPARPRDMWQLGVYGGLFMVDGDCPALPGWNVGVSIRKALGYVLSLRGSISYGQDKGLDYRKNANLDNSAALNVYRPTWDGGTNAANGGQSYYVANFKNTTINPSLDLLISFNNIMFHSKENKLNIYGLVGYSPVFYKTKIDALNGSAKYNYPGLAAGFFDRKRQDIRKDLKNFFDGNYETDASLNDRSQNLNKSGLGKYNFRHSFNTGVGVEYRLSKRSSLTGEMKYVWAHDDYMDGWSRQGEGYSSGTQAGTVVHSRSVLSPDKDNLVYVNLGINFNLGNMAKKTAPLWWLNPLDWVYSEINNPKHTLFPKQVLPDGDDDGVTDQFDIEPNTPAGCPVDAKGKSRDTDGDGVPDCRDKELITPTTCQPVNADGVGNCPDPKCCAELKKYIDEHPGGDMVHPCGIGDLPSVAFKGSSVSISGDAAAILATAAAKIKANPSCKICVVGHGTADKRAQQLSWDRANAVKTYLVEKLGISEDRFGFKYGEEGDSNTVDLMDCTGDDSPNSIPAPHPNLQKTK
ncbi:MAG: OmpA family protein [Chitinophagaceae bacterium]